MNGVIFKAYVERMLAPTLSPGDIVVMDNLSRHKIDGVRQAIEDRGARLLYLPPYSPDLNPIEMAPSQSSRPCSERPPNVPSMPSGTPSVKPSTPSHPRNARIISSPQDMNRSQLNRL